MAISERNLDILREQFPDVPIAAQFNDLSDYLRMPLEERIDAFNDTHAQFETVAEIELSADGSMHIDGNLIANLNRNNLTVLADLLRLPFGWYTQASLAEARYALEEHMLGGRKLGSLKAMASLAIGELSWVDLDPQKTSLIENGVFPARKVFMLRRGLQMQLKGNFDFLVDLRESDDKKLDRKSNGQGSFQTHPKERSNNRKLALPMYQVDSVAYRAVQQRRMNRVERTTDESEICILSLNHGVDLLYGEDGFELEDIEWRILDIVLASDGGITVRSVQYVLESFGIGIDCEEIVKIVRELQTCTRTDDRMPLLLLPTHENGQQAITLAPNVIVRDLRLRMPRNFQSTLACHQNPVEQSNQDMQSEVNDRSLDDLVAAAARMNRSEVVTKSKEYQDLREQLECFVLDKQPATKGLKPFQFPEETSTFLIAVAMDVFKNIELTPIERLVPSYVRKLSPAERKAYRSEIERCKKIRSSELARLDELAKFVYDLDRRKQYPKARFFELLSPVQFNNPSNCHGIGPGRFFVGRGDSLEPARSICRGCLAADECLDYALSQHEDFGVWGGASERERKRLKKVRAKEAEKKTAEPSIALGLDAEC